MTLPTPTPIPSNPIPILPWGIDWGDLINGALLILIGFFLNQFGNLLKVIWLRMKGKFFGYDKVYREKLQKSNSRLKFEGLNSNNHNNSMEVFYQEVEVVPIRISKVVNSIFQNDPDRFDGEYQPITNYLSDGTNAEGRRLVIVSSPGSGKSTLLMKLAFDLSKKQNKNFLRKLPIIIPLRGKKTIYEKDLLQVIIDQECNGLRDDKLKSTITDFFTGHLKNGTCLVMLDGLDEIGSSTEWSAAKTWIEQQINRNHRNDFILTSRPYAYTRNEISNASVILEIGQLKNNQIQDYLIKWFSANKETDSETKGNTLFNLIRNNPIYRDIFQLARNPLLLSIIAIVYAEFLHDKKDINDFPKKRVELLEEVCRVLIKERPQRRGDDPYDHIDKQKILETIAYQMMCESQSEISESNVISIVGTVLSSMDLAYDANQLLINIEQTSGIFFKFRSGDYSFAHSTFQEFLVSRYIAKNCLGGELLEKIEDESWYETIQMYVATPKVDATEIIEKCISSGSFTTYALALECAKVAYAIDPQTLASLNMVKDAKRNG